MPPSNIYSIPAHLVTRVCTARFCSCTSPVCFEGCSHSVPQRTLTWWAYRESRKGSSRQSLRKPHTASSAGRPPPSVGDRWSPQTWCLWRHNETTSQHETQPDFSQTSHFYPVNMPDPICIQSVSARKCWPEVGWMILAHQLAFGPDLSGQNLNQSVRTRYRLVLHNMIRAVCGRMQPSLKVGNWKQEGCVLLEPGPMITSFQTRCIWPKPDQAIQTGSRPALQNMIQAFFGRMDRNWMQKFDLANMIRTNSACMLAIMAITIMLLNQIWHVYCVTACSPLFHKKILTGPFSCIHVLCPLVIHPAAFPLRALVGKSDKE